jgi:homoserine dehydrogenase
VAEARRSPGGVAMSVAPVRVPAGSSLHAVPGEMNAVEVEGDFSGPLLFVGPGAGGDPTASALYADLVELARAHAVRRTPAIRLERVAGPPHLAR